MSLQAPATTPATQPMPAPRLPLMILMGLFALAFIPVSIMLPATDAISASLGADPSQVQQSLAVYLAGLGLGQPLYGQLSDRLGRKPVLLAGLAVFMVGSVLCALAQTTPQFWTGRFVQAAGAAAGATMGRAMINDVATPEGSVRMLAHTVMATTVAGALSPVTGTFIEAFAGWRAIAVALGLVGAVMFAAIWAVLPETRRTQPETTGTTRHGRLSLMKEPAFLRNALFSCALFGCWYAFLAGAPTTIIDAWGFSSTRFSTWWSIDSIAYLGGAYAAGRYSERFGPARMIATGSAMLLLSGVALVILSLTGPNIPATIFLPSALLLVGFSVAQTNATALAMAARPELAGMASGLLGMGQIAVGILCATLVAALPQDSATGFACVCLTTIVAAIAAQTAGRSRR